MRINWDKCCTKEDKISLFNSIEIKKVLEFHYYIDYNAFYQKTSYLNIKLSFSSTDDSLLLLKFHEVFNLHLDNFGGNHNEILGIKINSLKGRGMSKEVNYFIEDYINDTINFYCKEIEFI